ncbi:hypothetical protein HF521_009416 [Silurus meridionalis]|uniref:Uncharacterized protein n=1 Tax=Silurus meridionalis TaxID=175797 RepID=A0A8T0BU30_SILME|nr:hypothetical protein HF521_009416 [Silurus meridionalis]
MIFKIVFLVSLLQALSGAGPISFISKSHKGDNQLLNYVVNNSLREHSVLNKVYQRTMEDPWNLMMVSREQAQFMAILIKLIKGNKTIEIGMYTGYNTLSMALVIPEDGRVVACEINDTYVEIAKPFFKEAGVENKIDIRHQNALRTLDELLEAGEAETYDFVFIDADKKNLDNYYERSLQLIRKGGIIAIDNVLWGGRVINPDKDDVTTQVIDKLNKKLHKDQRVDLSMLTRFAYNSFSGFAVQIIRQKMLEEELKKLECHFTWDLQKEDADLNYLEIKFTESLSAQTDHGGNSRQKELNFCAYIYHLQGFSDKARASLEKAKETQNENSYNIVMYGNLAWLCHLMADDTMAKVYLEKLAQISGEFSSPAGELHREVLSEKAWSLLRFSKKHYVTAKEIFHTALQKEPEDKEWNTGYAFALFHLEGLEIREEKRIPFEESPAVNQLKRTLKLAPDNAMIHVFIGLKCYKNKRNAEAWVHMKQALDIAPYDLSVVLSVAKFMKKEQCYDMALGVLTKMLAKVLTPHVCIMK